MPASHIIREATKRFISAVLFVLLCTSTSAFRSSFGKLVTPQFNGRHSPERTIFHPSLSRSFSPLFSTSIVDTSIDDGFNNSSSASSTNAAVSNSPPKMNFLAQVKSLLSGNGLGNGKFSVDKESISKLGLNVLLAYGFVSNFSYITCLILAWVTHGKSTGLSPLVSGQWKKFLLVYATFFAANNILRPLRFTLSVAITPAFDKFIELVQKKSGWTRRTSTGVTIFLVNICGTFMYLFGGLLIATTIAKVPLLP